MHNGISITGDIMKLFRKIIATLLVALTIGQSNLFAEKDTANKTKLAAINQILHEQRTPREERNLIKSVYFTNDIREFLQLNDEFGQDPELLQRLLEHFSFTINGFEIKPGETKLIAIRSDKPFKFEMVAKSCGKIASLVSLAKKTTQDWVKSTAINLLNLLSFRISYECPLHEHNLHHNNIHYMADLIYEHPDMVRVLNNPDPDNLFKIIKKNGVTWPEWFALSLQLPEINNSNS